MRIEGETLIPASPEVVWQGLNDPDVLRRAIPGCDTIEQTGEQEFTATVVVRVGPVSAAFKGKVELADLDPPRSYTLRGRGQGGPAGFAKGEARVTLVPEADETRLVYVADVEVGGKLASVGGRLIQGVARKTADEFFAAFRRAVTGEAAAPAGPSEAPSGPGVSPVREGRAGHIPLIDRVAWFLVGLAVGIGLMAMAG